MREPGGARPVVRHLLCLRQEHLGRDADFPAQRGLLGQDRRGLSRAVSYSPRAPQAARCLEVVSGREVLVGWGKEEWRGAARRLSWLLTSGILAAAPGSGRAAGAPRLATASCFQVVGGLSSSRPTRRPAAAGARGSGMGSRAAGPAVRRRVSVVAAASRIRGCTQRVSVALGGCRSGCIHRHRARVRRGRASVV